MKLQLTNFAGIAPMLAPHMLAPNQAQIAKNVHLWTGGIDAVTEPSLVTTVATTQAKQTIFKYGQYPNDSDYWFTWPYVADAVRGLVSSDTSEKVYWTGDGNPKKSDLTRGVIAAGDNNYPSATNYYDMGVPIPSGTPVATLTETVPAEKTAAALTISKQTIDTFAAGKLLGFSKDGITFNEVTMPAAPSAAAIKSLIEANSDLAWLTPSLDSTEGVPNGGLTVTTVDTGATASVYARIQTTSVVDLTGTKTYGAFDLNTATTSIYTLAGGATTTEFLVLDDTAIGDLDTGDVLTFTTKRGTAGTITIAGGFAGTAAALAPLLNAAFVAQTHVTLPTYTLHADVIGGCVFVRAGSSETDEYVQYARVNGGTVYPTIKKSNSAASSAAHVFIDNTLVEQVDGGYVAVTINSGTEQYVEIAAGATVSSFSIGSGELASTTYGVSNPVLDIRTLYTGGVASIRIRDVTFSETLKYTNLQSAKGTTETSVTEDRVYLWTFVTNWGEEGGPCSPESNTVTVTDGDTVTVTLPSAPGGQHNVTHIRVYRSTLAASGTSNYYLVNGTDIPLGTAEYEDTVLNQNLGEPLTTLTYLPPPPNGVETRRLVGLTALPNGILAGFVEGGKDVYFCEPYKPYAWPLDYIQTVDYDIVALAPLQQNLLVLTTGSPYMIYSADPSNSSMQKLDIAQACVSGRSVAQFGNGVIYASPDGMVYVGTEGSDILTKSWFTRKQWQEINPESIHGVQHDTRYYGWWKVDANTKGCFVIDTTTQNGVFTTTDIWADASYSDLVQDALFFSVGANIYKWEGTNETTPVKRAYDWKSKVFLVQKPTCFSAAKVMAVDYTSVTALFYVDSVLKHTQVVTSQEPFRLPSGFMGKRFEVEFTGTSTVFDFIMAESMTELGSG